MAKLKSKLVEAANKVWETWRKFGPVDDGRPEGDAFDEALMELRLTAKRTKFQTEAERAALVAIVNAYEEVTEPCHYKIREAIQAAQHVLADTDLEVEG